MEDIHFLEGKELKYSRAYYELSVPDIVKRVVFIILGIIFFILIYIILAPYNVIVKADAQIRPSQDLVYITPITSGIVKEKLFKNGQKVVTGQTLYVLDNTYIDRELETQIRKLDEYKGYVKKDQNILKFLKNYENQNANINYVVSIENQIKKLKFELETCRFQYEVATKLFPQTISKMELQDAENNFNKAKIEFENYISDNLVKYTEELDYNNSVVSEIEANIEKLRVQLSQSVLKSTCDGYVEELQIINSGESIIAESKIARIIPESNGKLNIYIYVNVQDIAELHDEDEFTLSLPKYPSSNFSSIKGHLSNISKDSILGADGQPYFLITGVLNNIDFIDKRNKKTIGLVPGMTGTARIKVRTEPLYVYLLKQIY